MVIHNVKMASLKIQLYSKHLMHQKNNLFGTERKSLHDKTARLTVRVASLEEAAILVVRVAFLKAARLTARIASLEKAAILIVNRAYLKAASLHIRTALKAAKSTVREAYSNLEKKK